MPVGRKESRHCRQVRLILNAEQLLQMLFLAPDLKVIEQRESNRDDDRHGKSLGAESEPDAEKHAEKVKRVPTKRIRTGRDQLLQFLAGNVGGSPRPPGGSKT